MKPLQGYLDLSNQDTSGSAEHCSHADEIYPGGCEVTRGS